MSQKPQQNGTSDVIKVRYEKLDALKEAGRDPFVITTSARDVLTETIKNNFEEYENKDVCVAGRLLSKKRQGQGFVYGPLGSFGQNPDFCKI